MRSARHGSGCQPHMASPSRAELRRLHREPIARSAGLEAFLELHRRCCVDSFWKICGLSGVATVCPRHWPLRCHSSSRSFARSATHLWPAIALRGSDLRRQKNAAKIFYAGLSRIFSGSFERAIGPHSIQSETNHGARCAIIPCSAHSDAAGGQQPSNGFSAFRATLRAYRQCPTAALRRTL